MKACGLGLSSTNRRYAFPTGLGFAECCLAGNGCWTIASRRRQRARIVTSSPLRRYSEKSFGLRSLVFGRKRFVEVFRAGIGCEERRPWRRQIRLTGAESRSLESHRAACSTNSPSPTRKQQITAGGALCADTGVHTGRSPKDKFVVVDATTKDTVWWEKNGKLTPEQFDALLKDFLEHAKGKELFAQDLYGGADPKYRIKTRVYTELAWHSIFIRALLRRPERAELAELRARADHPLPAELQGRPEEARRAQRDRDRPRLHPQDHPDRRQLLRRRDEEVGLLHAQLLPAAAGRDADALLRQCRQERRRRAVLRPFRHRQDHALGRSEPHAARRRRARLGSGRRVQFRGRLLRQDHPAVAGGRARDLRHHPALRQRPGKCGVRSGDARLRFRRRVEDRKHARRLSDRLHSRMRRSPAAPAIRRTSCCWRPMPSA